MKCEMLVPGLCSFVAQRFRLYFQFVYWLIDYDCASLLFLALPPPPSRPVQEKRKQLAVRSGVNL